MSDDTTGEDTAETLIASAGDRSAEVPDDVTADATAGSPPPEAPVAFQPDTLPCPNCGEPVPVGANFCEGCGAQLGEVTEKVAQAGPKVDRLGSVPISRPTHLVTDTATPAPRRPCAECGGPVGDDLYCELCGTKAPSEREHFREAPASWVAGVCDRGAKRPRNEDAMSLVASESQGERCVLIVLDGVGSSTDSDVASLAGARAARDSLRTAIPQGLGTPESRESAVHQAITDAAAAAQTAIVAHTDLDSSNPASATFTCVVVEAEPEGPVAWHGNIGDSRSYWVPDAGEAVQLTRDDSAAEALMAAGMSAEEAHGSAQAHAITKWLGRDSEDIVPVIGRLPLTEDGWVLACSDGFWNYAADPAEVSHQVQAAVAERGAEPEAVALALVEWANAQGGHDNITVALARLGTLPVSETGTSEDGHDPVHSDTTAPGTTEE
ncbi:MAG: PP2C family serine/threonine-protein phosphatase [Dermatophilaceae bacterium]|nr:protein phosphatase 2C domain-containing protein [Intrasporangiaceae bacterium]